MSYDKQALKEELASMKEKITEGRLYEVEAELMALVNAHEVGSVPPNILEVYNLWLQKFDELNFKETITDDWDEV